MIRSAGEALAYLVAGYMNDHLFSEACQPDYDAPMDQWDRSECMGCCPNCCGPCGAMRYFRDARDNPLTRTLAAFMPEADYTWQRPDSGVDWAKVQWHWDNVKPVDCHGDGLCH